MRSCHHGFRSLRDSRHPFAAVARRHIVLSPAESPAYVDEMFPGITDEFMRFLDQLGAPEDLRPHAATLHKHYHLLVQTLEQAADSLAEVVPPQATPSHATPTSATPTS